VPASLCVYVHKWLSWPRLTARFFFACTQQLPEFPPKKYFGSLSPALIKERQEALEKYMKHLVSDKKVLQCKELRQFLETPDTTDPEKHKEYDFGRR
jgi:hypothetical protein